MTTEEFWEIYTSEADPLKICDITYDFFLNDLPADFLEDYDVGEVIVETIGHNEDNKRFDKVIAFTELIQKKHPALYLEYFEYIDSFLIDFYCFHKNNKEVENAFLNFANDPEKDFDNLLAAFKQLLFYGYFNTTLDTTIIKIYDTVKNSSRLVGGSALDLAMSKFYINLENYYNKTDKSNSFNRKEFTSSLSSYDFTLENKAQEALENGLLASSLPLEEIIDHFIQNRSNCMLTLQGLFLKEMKTKNFPFTISGRLWDKILEFWEEQADNNKQKPDDYFSIQPAKFDQYLTDLSGNLFINNTSEMIAVLWGSVYIYDFLYSIGLINESTYNSFIKTSKKFKGDIIGDLMSSLWNSNFVHHWAKPDSVSEIEFREEEKIFQKSMSFKFLKFSSLKSEISEELKNIGELSEYIIQGGKKAEDKLNSFLDNSSGLIKNTKKSDIKDTIQYIDHFTTMEPIRAEKKVGRNDSCPCGSEKKYKKCCMNN